MRVQQTKNPDIAEPVITVRAQLRSSPGAQSRDPLPYPGYASHYACHEPRSLDFPILKSILSIDDGPIGVGV